MSFEEEEAAVVSEPKVSARFGDFISAVEESCCNVVVDDVWVWFRWLFWLFDKRLIGLVWRVDRCCGW